MSTGEALRAASDGLTFDLRLLGPIEIDSGSGTLPLGTRKQRAILTILAVARGHVVSADRLVDELWGDEAPARALALLYPYVSNLRRSLEPDRAPQARPRVLVSVPPGYALHVPAERLDVARFEHGARRASELLAEHRLDEARDAADAALAEWRGPALGEFAGEGFAVAEAIRLEEMRLATMEDLFAIRLVQADTRLPADVEHFLGTNPLRERAWGILMRALYAGGRQSDALRAFQRARTVLAEELGVQPGPELQALEHAVLRQDDDLTAGLATGPPERSPVSEVSRSPVPVADAPVADAPVDDETPADELLGRADAVATALTAFDDARAGRARTLVVSGEPGTGKSHLVRLVSAAARRAEVRVAIGTCDEGGASPFAPWNEILAKLGLEGIGHPGAVVDSPDVELGLRRLIELLSRRLRDALREGPLVIVLEDLQWSDRSSLRAFEHVAREFRSEPLLLVGDARDEAAPALVHTLGGVARTPGYVRIELERIAPADIRTLAAAYAGRPLDPTELDVIARRTAGNPFFVIQLARWIARRGAADEGVPVGVADVVRRQVSRLPGNVIDVLSVAAAVGQAFEVEVLANAVGRSPEEVFDVLDVAVVNRIVEPITDHAAGYRFVHALVRDAILLDLAPLRRARTHHRIAEAIAARSPASPDLASHRWEARSVALDEARAACRRAAEAAEVAYSVVEATRWWERALALEPATGVDRARVLLALGKSLTRLEQLPDRPIAVPSAAQLTARDLEFESARSEGWARLLESIDVALQAGDHATAAAAAVEVGSGWNAWHWCGFRVTPSDTIRRLEAVHDAVGDERAADRAAILANLAIGRYNDEPVDTSDALSAGAVDVARTTSDTALLAHTLLSRALAIERPGRDGERLDCVEEVLGLSGATVEQRASALLVRAGIRLRAADRDAAQSDVADVRRLARQHQLVREDLQTQIFDVTLALVDGDPERAEALALDAIARGVSQMATAGPPIGFLALYSMRLAQDRGSELVDDARAIAPLLRVHVADLAGPALLAAGRTDEAAALAREISDEPVPPDWFWLGQQVLRGRLAAAVGPDALARRQYELLAPFAGSAAIVPGFIALGVVDVTLGHLASAVGDRQGAIGHLRAGVAVATRLGATTWAADAGAALDALGDR